CGHSHKWRVTVTSQVSDVGRCSGLRIKLVTGNSDSLQLLECKRATTLANGDTFAHTRTDSERGTMSPVNRGE
ncbi:hypothetical protein M5D96_008015, partial [Drosophila gunungcola]